MICAYRGIMLKHWASLLFYILCLQWLIARCLHGDLGRNVMWSAGLEWWPVRGL